MRKLFLAIFLLIATISVSAATPSSECTSNSTSPACQEPVFADNQDSYWYDLKATDVTTGEPSKSSLTVLHGSTVGNLGNEEQTKVSEWNKKEKRIINDGPAGTGGFADGEVSEKDINLPSDSLLSQDTRGEYAVNPPHEAEKNCGDGKKNTGDSESCPEDHLL